MCTGIPWMLFLPSLWLKTGLASFSSSAASLDSVFIFMSCGPGTTASTRCLKFAVSLISKRRSQELLSSTDETWSPVFSPERPNLHPALVQMSLYISPGLEPSAWDSCGLSPSLACQCLCEAGDGLEMLSAIKRLLLEST